MVIGADVVVVENCKQLFSALGKPGQGIFAFMVDLKRTISEVRKRVDELQAA